MKRRERKRYEKLFGDKPVYEMTEEEKQEPISKKVGKTLKHRLERRWYRRLVVEVVHCIKLPEELL